jgi:hypothetical protein
MLDSGTMTCGGDEPPPRCGLDSAAAGGAPVSAARAVASVASPKPPATSTNATGHDRRHPSELFAPWPSETTDIKLTSASDSDRFEVLQPSFRLEIIPTESRPV